ncbi:MAG TPA: HAD family hydrolase [Coleofasciculaceae cyanobacterium]|jgi:FMN phosphatase YigB (HAD superfamily)
MTKIASFDVFDTVLTRAVGSPESSFLLLGKKLKDLSLLDYPAEVFARVRANAESRAFVNAGGLDSQVNLHQIYAEVGMALGLTEAQRNQLMNLELQLETQIIRLVPHAKELVQAARDRNERIAFLSDMYLGTECIQKLLSHHGLYLDGDLCYVSCDYAKSKGSGELFQELLQRERVEPEQVCHCGNNSWSDVHTAKQAGLKVRPFPEGNLNRYEEILETYTWATQGLSSVMAGASRLARLTVPASSPREKVLRDISASVAAPVLVSFVLWALGRAQQLGLKRLYFVSRDGQMLLEIARRLIKKLNFSCELCYLYGSRQAWLLPSVTRVDEEHLKGIFTGQLTLDVEFVSVRIALARLCIEPEEASDCLISIGLTNKDWLRNLNVDERIALTQLVLEDQRMRELILQKADQQRQLMVKYLKQEGLLDPTPFGLVDLGTGATLHYALSEVLTVAGGKPPVSFYQGLRKGIPEGQFREPEPYLFDKRLGLGFFEAPGMNEITEMACSADHGTVISYREVGERVEPVLKEDSNPVVMDWGYPIVRETICCFAENILLDASLINLSTDVRAACVELCNAFWSNPSVTEAKAWGDFPMEDGWGNESFYHCFAESYRWSDLITTLWDGRLRGRRHWWESGALALSPPRLRAALRVCLSIGQRQRRVRARLRLGQYVKRQLGFILAPKG